MGLLDVGLGAWQSAKNISMQRETNALNYRMWQEQLEYDKPVNQVGRLKEAGLNPALMYGTGSGANTSPNPIRAEAPQGSVRGEPFDPGVIVGIQQARLLGEQARALKLDNDAIEAAPGSTRRDSAPVRELRKGVEALRQSELGRHIGPTIEMMRKKPTSALLGDAVQYWAPGLKKFWDEGKEKGFFFTKSKKGGEKK